jgi:hypothetical protein
MRQRLPYVRHRDGVLNVNYVGVGNRLCESLAR